MRLSDAIALGRMLEPMDMGDFQHCALGVGLAAVGVPVCDRLTTEMYLRWPWLLENATQAPFGLQGQVECSNWLRMISYSAIYTTHNKKYTLDQLIDWVRSVEPAEILETHELEAVANGDNAKVIT